MTTICLGPCCIPVSVFVPALFLLISPILRLLRSTPLAKYLPDPNASKKPTAARQGGAGCCSSTACKDGQSGVVTAVASMDEWEEFKRLEPTLIVDFTAEWCKPCKMMAPVYAALANEFKDAARFLKVDIDDLPDAFDGISIPAFHVLRNGTKVDAVSGAGEERLRNMITKHCQSAK